ncbi:MAG: amino acid adenylation domain-containing protein, partial [Chroococcidiopsidaceae cyanobacterium CP_BM_ER_R8_30]|nr:amino acid adenylation domain-containing protein [Chroococcidiopsidaceae cyanobacterium CP_BM_ER_R8_30]
MEPIAIVGIGCRFPKAHNPEAFWQLLHKGIDAITEVPPERWDIDTLYDPDPNIPGKMNTRWGGFLDQVDQFEPGFFGISPREAQRIDPQQRLVLEVVWEALENAGMMPKKLAGSQTGVFFGISNLDYHRLLYKELSDIEAYNGTGTSPCIVANRVSYLLDLRGPSVAIDTACSSSLVAVHLACQSLQSGETDLCLAGGVNLILSPEPTITFSQAHMMAADGRCKTFDASADGYVRGEGCGVVILKRFSDALRDGDNILALIRGSAVNQDGLSNGITAPNGPAQQAVIRQALKSAECKPAQISYVEAHGTGTSLGDPIEIKSLKAVLMENRSPEQPCWIGSVKTNIGHLEAAAGIASLIKVVLSLQNQEIPPHLHLNQLNPYISLAGTPFAIPSKCQPWSCSGNRLAGISAFSFGGTNSHVILEEAPVISQVAGDIERPLHLLTLSARSEKALKEVAQRYQDFLGSHLEASLADICFTANTGRSHFNYRLSLIAESTVQMRSHLSAFATGKQTLGVISAVVQNKKRPKIAFLFTGQGSQYHDMGRKLYETQPTFRATLERCDRVLYPYLGQSLLKLLYAPDATNVLHATAYTQPALFALEYALSELWRSWGIIPDAVMGHSVGEYVAACVAGVFSLEDGLKLVAERSRLMQSLPQEGEMAVVFAGEKQVLNTIAHYESQIAIAAVNGPENIVISGVREAVQSALDQFQSEGILVKPLQVSHAFHSPLMNPILDEFERQACQIQFKAPRIALISNLTGQILKPGEIPDASYWRCHLREPVQFAAGMNTLAEHGYQIFLEIGPRDILLGMGKRCLGKETGLLWLPSLQLRQDDWHVLLNSLAMLETQGVNVDWAGFDKDYQRHRMPLPTYPFERKRYWIESDKKRDVTLMHVNNSENSLPKPQIETTQKTQLGDSIRSQLRGIVARLLQIDPADVDIYAPFLEMGADSLVLVEAIRTIENSFEIKIAIRQLFEELTTIDALATYINNHLPPSLLNNFPPSESEPSMASQQPALQTSVDVTETAPVYTALDNKARMALPETVLERVIGQQLEVMTQQLEVLGYNRVPAQTSFLKEPALSKFLSQPASNSNYPADASFQSQDVSSNKASVKVELNKANVHPSSQLIKSKENGKLSLEQQRHLEALIARYTKRTQKSKQQTQSERPFLADRRSSAGFRWDTKEVCYPIIGQHSQGSKIWDVDGNEYVDLTMGFGVHLFGHNPPFITEALKEQLQQGIQIGPRSQLAGEVAALICELTGVERVSFCNSGTEAVMTALRLARTATGRTKIAMFTGSYHGHFDGTLATAQTVKGELSSAPLAPGVPQNVVDDVLVLNYGDLQSLDIIKAHAQQLAAVLVEPVQSRRPDLQPKAFLQQLRKLTQEAGIALVFDEVLLGFRIHPGGTQAWFDIKADLVTYAKVVGGGMPIGVVAGKTAYMDGIDGGMWNFGDASYPQAETTYFAGTFSKHPLAMAASRAVLKQLKEQGPTLQQQLNQRTAQLAQSLNTYFEQNDVPIQVVHFGSLFRFVFAGNYSVFNQPLEMELLFYHLLEKGVYIWEGRSCLLSTAHTDEDINYVIQAVKDSVTEMRSGGFFPKCSPNVPKLGKQLEQQINKVNFESNIQSLKVTEVEAQPTGFWERKTYKPALTYRKPTGIKLSRDPSQGMSFSLYYFGKYESEFNSDKYNLLFEGAKFADRSGFAALWLPERHFHAFGGFSPNPSVIGAALARETQHIQIRAGSVVLPLHHPIRVAEEWAVVDNLSKGRVGISFASGWHANDFVLAPESYGKHRELMFQEIKTVQKLWRGEPIQFRDGAGSDINIKLFPMPMQSDVPIWITVVNNPETYIRAGEIGAGILTNLMGQTIEDLARNIALYRESLSKHRHDLESGQVTVLLHTFVGDDLNLVREKARQPFYNYLRSTVGLFQNLVKSQGLEVDLDKLSEDDIDYILSKAYERYVQTSALIGTPNSCSPIIENLIAIGVDEIACFVDFGVDNDSVVEGFQHLDQLKECYKKPEDSASEKSHSSLTTVSSSKEVKPEVLSIPLTPTQKQLWLLAQIGNEASSAYNESIMFRLRGSLHLETIHQAFQKVVDRHEALRTIISPEGEIQQILPSLTIDVPVIDFSSLDPSERETKVAHCLKQATQQSFDLVRGPLLRVNLLKLEEQLHLLIFTAHHIIIDGLSIGLLLQEVATFYSAECQGIDCEQEPPLQFQEYIKWQEQQSKSPEITKQEAYWIGQFADQIPVLELPTDHPRPPVKTYSGARTSLQVEANLYAEIKRLSKQKGCTLFMTLLAVYIALLHCWTNQNDVVVGIPVAQRKMEGSEKMVGYCAELLPIRSRLVGSPTFSEFLTTIRRVLLDAYEHQDYTFAQLLNQLNLSRDPSRSPLVSATFNQDRASGTLQMFGLEMELVSSPISYTKFEVHLNAIEIKDKLLLEVDYNTDLFDATTINQMLLHFHTWLKDIVANQDLRLKDLPLLTEAERHQLLFEWNDTQVNYPQDKCIHELFEAQVKRTPDAVAVVFEDEQLTYSELNDRANCLAYYLRSLGVGPEVQVGLCLERSVEIVAAILGILKAGGAYVPFDPTYPQERLTFMLQDAQVSVLLTQQDLVEKLPEHQARIVCLDKDWQADAFASRTNLVSGVTPLNLAYIIYTSGSTGQPKGVMVPHRGVCNLLQWRQTAFGLNQTDRLLQTISVSFDPSVWQIFWPLSFGAQLVMARPGGHQDTAYLVKQIAQQQITAITQVPSMLRLLLEEKGIEDCKCLRHITCGGEALPVELIERFFAHLDLENVLHNFYGPTEASIDATFWTCDRGTNQSIAPIGRPIANAEIYILDADLQPVAVGEPGELYIGGLGLARGYFNRPDLTALKFIPHPWSQEAGARLYKTGDLARYLLNGNIEFLGRIDNQVKIRGFRIELGEIETALSQHSAV